MKPETSTHQEPDADSPAKLENLKMLAEAVREAFRALPEKHRATIFKKAAPLRPKTTNKVLQAAHIPPTFQPERISYWLRRDHLLKMEEIVLSPQNEEWFDGILRAFFCEAHLEVNEWLLNQVESPVNPLTFEEAIAGISSKFPKEPFANLYMACIRWVCHDKINDHDDQVREIREKLDSSNVPAPEDPPNNMIPVVTKNIAPPQAAPATGKLAEFDEAMQALSQELDSLRNLKPLDIETLTTNVKAAQKIVDGLVSQLQQMANETGQPMPTWKTRDEFFAAWIQMTSAVEKMRSAGEKVIKFKLAIADLLQTVQIRHRMPKKQAQLCELARRAAAEFRDSHLALDQLQLSGPPDAAEWLKWLWSMEGDAADETHAKLQIQLPVLAELIAVTVRWDDLVWSPAQAKPVPSQSGPTAAKEPAETLPHTTTPAINALVEPSTSLPVSNAATTSQMPALTASSEVSVTSKNLRVIPVEKIVPPVLPAKDSKSKPVIKPATQPAETPKPLTLPPATDAKVSTKVSIPVAVPASLPKIAARENSTAPDPKIAPPPILVSPQPFQGETIADIVWDLARQGRLGLASHIAALDKSAELPPFWVFEAAALASRLNYEVSPLSERIAQLFLLSGDFVFENLSPSKQPATRLLLVAAALRPALLAPQTSAASLLKLASINGALRLSAFGALVEAAAEFGLHQQPLQPHMLLSTHNRVEWEQQMVRVREDIEAWVEKAPKSHFSFAPALRIWLAWTGTNGSLVNLLKRTAQATVKDADELTKAWANWSDAPAEQVQAAMKALGQWKIMDGVHRDKLISRLQEAIDLANRMLALLGQSPQEGSDFREKKIQHQLDFIRLNLEPAMSELREMAANASPDIQASTTLCIGTLEGIKSLFTGNLPLPGTEEPKPCWLVDAELLRDAAFQVNSDGVLLPPVPEQQERLVALAWNAPDWKMAWQTQVAAKNHAATAALLEAFRWQLPVGLDPLVLTAQRERDLEDCRKKLEIKVDATRRLLNESASLGFCREEHFLKWTNDVSVIEIRIPNATNINQLNQDLEKIDQEVQTLRESETANVRQRAENSSIASNVSKRIISLLDAGDIHTAIDYLDRIEMGHSLPDKNTSNEIFNTFFAENGWLSRAEALLRNSPINDCWQAASTGTTWNFLDFQSLGLDQRATAVSHLKLWQQLERARRASTADALQLASSLGLQPTKVDAHPTLTGSHVVQPFTVHTQLMEGRATTVVPSYGSAAMKRYTIHLVWGEPRADELISLCRREIGDTSAHIVVAFRVLNTLERYELAEEARKTERLFKGVVIDRALFTFACAQTTARLSTLLRCALPFSCVEPYTISAGEVPPEMFFGRGNELESLAQPRGSCFVYGGRQLGKTALLRALERRFHNLAQGRAAVFVDLKRELFSRGRPLDDLWNVLLTHLKDIGVLVDIKVSSGAGQDAFVRHVKDWLNAAPERRLLLLLDEADSFLEQDGKENDDHYEPFRRCQRLKGLMEDTKYRFKVIFAGLHNVQRTTRYSNHPLAHFGDAICIGPMLGEAESREARALVEQPMSAAGYTFESPDVVWRILALTNFYPSLIQLFCHHLLLDLRANHVVRFPKPRQTPPCVITSQHVQAVYGSTVRKRINEKIRLTLDLDKRFEVIAYLLAYYNSLQSGQDGVDLREIRTEASGYWPDGFAEMRTDDEFRSLLDEMVGLGILRQVTNSNRYALRNNNVISLLGSLEEILRQLDAAKTWDPVLKYEADKFRRLINDKSPMVYSPLTAMQESDLKPAENRVAILYGVTASGLTEVPAAMESDGLFGKSRSIILRNCTDAQMLSDRIASVDRPPNSNSIIIVPPEINWDESWIIAACHRLSQLTSKNAFLTVLFLADSKRAIATLHGTDGAVEQGVRQFTLSPWHDAAVRRWLQDVEIQSDRTMRDKIRLATGNWPILLLRLNISSAETIARSCEDLAQLFNNPTELSKLYTAFGFSKEIGDEPLRMAAELKKFQPGEVCEFIGATDDASRQRVMDSLKAAELIGLINIAAGGFEFDPVAASILIKSNKPQ